MKAESKFLFAILQISTDILKYLNVCRLISYHTSSFLFVTSHVQKKLNNGKRKDICIF